jgi:hypothetical protein
MALQLEWHLLSVDIDVPDDGRGSGRLAVFANGVHRAAFRVVALHPDGNLPARSFADWTRPDGDSSHQWGEPHAVRIDGVYCPEVVIELLGVGLRNGSVSPVKVTA